MKLNKKSNKTSTKTNSKAVSKAAPSQSAISVSKAVKAGQDCVLLLENGLGDSCFRRVSFDGHNVTALERWDGLKEREASPVSLDLKGSKAGLMSLGAYIRARGGSLSGRLMTEKEAQGLCKPVKSYLADSGRTESVPIVGEPSDYNASIRQVADGKKGTRPFFFQLEFRYLAHNAKCRASLA